MPNIEIKTEYRTLEEIATRIGKRPRSTRKLIKEGLLPVKKFGRDYVMSELAWQDYLRKV